MTQQTASKKRARRRESCGTLAGHSAHSRAGERFCDDCRQARRAYDAARPQQQQQQQQRKRPKRRESCGTVSGYTLHSRERERFCDDCRQARRAYDRQRASERAEAVERRVQAEQSERAAVAQREADARRADIERVSLSTPEERWTFYRSFLDESQIERVSKRASLRQRLRFFVSGRLEQ